MLLGLERALLLECLRRVGAVRVGRFVLASGREAPYYVDVRRATLDSEGARLVGKAVARAVEGRPEVQAVGGLTLGADPIVGATLAQVTRPLAGFLVRARAKDHGTRCQIEGPLEPGMTVAIVDDVATTGGSILQVVDAVAVLGCRVAGVYVVMDRLEGAREALAARGIALEALLTVRDLGLEPQVLSV